MEPQLIDAHCHLDLMAHPDAVADEATALGLGLFDCGVDPRDFSAANERAHRQPGIIAGIGLHPWWLADGRCGTAEIDLLCKIAPQERYIGEVGLDFSPRFADTEGIQTQAFDRLCQTLSQYPLPGRVLSIHAIRAAGAILNILESHSLLEDTPSSPVIIFHWFSGTSDELVRARNAGCYFSVNERMLTTKCGHEYARQIPLGHLLLETDAPSDQQSNTSAQQLVASLKSTSRHIAELKNCAAESIESIVLDNSRSIFAFR
ncbi:TatD family deoxyribonuclease [Collinsella sp. AF37-9]|uniref:TatD family hydrolase n=1 Tax=Collinsella sp. AF37-9 TaxID=2292014 RepID=UPI000E5218FA|nr:TatD family hydrolase [Collinsella sp. AF37-9]RHL38384.1 TatD family deoxyribonuclease [Collinsella sp. AF37-9]